MVEPMLNVLWRYSFSDFVEISQKFAPLLSLEIITKTTHFLPAKKMIPMLWIKLQRNKNAKCLKTLQLNTVPVKNSQTARTFSKNVNKKAGWEFSRGWKFSSGTFVWEAIIHEAIVRGVNYPVGTFPRGAIVLELFSTF